MWIEGAVFLEIDGNCLRNLGLTLMISSFLLSKAVLKLLLIHRFSRCKTRSKGSWQKLRVSCEGRNSLHMPLHMPLHMLHAAYYDW